MGQIEDDIVGALAAAGLTGKVVTQLAPGWTTDWITAYGREQLRAVVLLVESRVLGAQDGDTIAWLRSIGCAPVVVATKVDKLKPSERVSALRRLREGLGVEDGTVFMVYSSVTGEGRERLWTALKDRCRT